MDKPPIPIIIKAEITDVWGSYDGTSQEFQLKIISVKEKKVR